ncbi:hypothetical protein Pan216_19080 [Planctomycetes bacterium Pan216]|uniref:DUF1559 domain-containing protein n=1 Tax=Kolteria novifilia TaxID=2527975 RepID=A0A518B243_9BACT|nr:hypothetical protein Pan216_19080 [Planctomycetes bacterium Pan216]
MTHVKGQMRVGFTLVELLVVIAIIGVLVGLLLPAVQQARESARRSQCQNNLKQLGQAMHNYHEAHGILPFGAMGDLSQTPACSTPGGCESTWMVMILPYIDQQSLYDKFSPLMDTTEAKEWMHTNAGNVVEAGVPIGTLVCPSDPNSPKTTAHWGGTHDYNDGFCGNYSMCNGDTTITTATDKDPGSQTGLFFHYSGIRFKDVSDGLSKTIMGGEHVAVRDSSSERDWRGRYYRGKHLGVLISTLETPNTQIPDRLIRCDNKDYAPCTSNQGSDNVMYARSVHPGGAHCILADGAVEFFSDSIDRSLFQGLGTRNGSEITSY